MSKKTEKKIPQDGKGLKIGVVVGRFNSDVTERLLEGALHGLEECGVQAGSIRVVKVPGAFEIPGMALRMSSTCDAVVCLGAVIAGETDHYTYVSKAVQEGILRASLDSGKPIIFGVLTARNESQALDRAGGAEGNEGYDAAIDAVEMANLYRSVGK